MSFIEERRDTYDSRRIDGLEASTARLEERIENLREKIDGFRADFNRERQDAMNVQREATAAARSLRNSILGGCCVAGIIAVAERLLT